MDDDQKEMLYGIFVDWRSRPAKPTDPKTLEEFCSIHNTDMSTLQEFVKRPEFADDIRSATMIWARTKLPEIFHMAYDEVKKSKSMGDVEKFVNLIEDLRKKDKDTKNLTQYNFFNTLPDEVYGQIIQREAKSIEASSTKEAS